MRHIHFPRWTRFVLVSLVTTLAFIRPAGAQSPIAAWGYNGTGGLGDNTGVDRNQPVNTVGLTDVVALAGGYDFSVAALSDGTVWAWGSGDSGQLGTGGTSGELAPVAVPGVANIRSLVAGYSFVLALSATGSVFAWGDNSYGQLGDGTTTTRLSPVPVAGLPADIVTVGCGRFHSYALTSAGQVWAWGDNATGQFGDGTTIDSAVPVLIGGLPPIVAIDGGTVRGVGFTIALDAAGFVWTWGGNDVGQLGDGTTANRPTPAIVGGLDPAVGVSAALDHCLALLADGTVSAWGANTYGQLGDGTFSASSIPVSVKSPDGISVLSNITAVTSGFHSLALRADGSVLAWGYNLYGAVGDGTNVDRNLPVVVTCMSGVTVIAAADYHSMALGTNQCGATSVAGAASADAATRLAVRWLSRSGHAELEYEIARPGRVALAVFDVHGRRVTGLVEGTMGAGHHATHWNGRWETGARAASGVYFVRLSAPGTHITAKFIVLP